MKIIEHFTEHDKNVLYTAFVDIGTQLDEDFYSSHQEGVKREEIPHTAAYSFLHQTPLTTLVDTTVEWLKENGYQITKK
jgi:hypothetical protein